MNNILYIGLNGYAGSGKDTVAKMLHHILNRDWSSYDECRQAYHQNAEILATYENSDIYSSNRVFCIAFADQLKNICASMFGIPVERFYYNKANSWICINKDFEYTESKPLPQYIISAEDYYTCYNVYNNYADKYWMSLRELLVYVGTYVCQQHINKQIFINIVNNTINRKVSQHSNEIRYAIVTDVRFLHELEFIHNKKGITINIYRYNVKQLDNIAEHDLDDSEDFDFIIDNNGTYDELFRDVWDMVHNNAIFSNYTIELDSRDNTNNYLRLVENRNDYDVYSLCTEFDIVRVQHSDGYITKIDPSGGPMIVVGKTIDAEEMKVPLKIYTIENKPGFYIDLKK
ncbi:MAG: hypothetical protein J6D03_00025 [Clostridia bacterium]|nr:hypothetical protein [Clostridia bacterium]